jgi:hypothetical protein
MLSSAQNPNHGLAFGLLIWINTQPAHLIYCSRDDCGVQKFCAATGRGFRDAADARPGQMLMKLAIPVVSVALSGLQASRRNKRYLEDPRHEEE